MDSAIDIEQAERKLDKTAKNERKRLFEFIRRRVKTDADAEDILQDVFYQMVASYNVTEPIEQLTSWLFTVARNKIIDWYRKKRLPSIPIDETGDDATMNLADILNDPRQDPDASFARSLLWDELADALEEMPEKQREVFVLHEMEGRSFKEIAEMTGEPVNTLLSRKRYAVLYLREQLQELYNELFD